MPRIVVPVGFNLGARHRYVSPPDPQPDSYEIHLGAEIVELAADEAAAYAFAFLDVERHATLKVTREWLIQAMRTAPQPQPDAERLVNGLVDRGLLLEFDPDGPLESVFRRYRLFPTAEGMGTTAEEPEYYRMGHLGQPLVAVPNDTYMMWAFSYLHPNLWEACAYYAKADVEELEEGEEPIGLTAEGIARQVATNLPMMVTTLCAYVDPVAQL
jgi:hypothetical protein